MSPLPAGTPFSFRMYAMTCAYSCGDRLAGSFWGMVWLIRVNRSPTVRFDQVALKAWVVYVPAGWQPTQMLMYVSSPRRAWSAV
jgi:hypothetical protein